MRKFFLILLLICLLPFLIVSVMGYYVTYSALKEDSYNLLKVVRDIQKAEIENHFKEALIKTKLLASLYEVQVLIDEYYKDNSKNKEAKYHRRFDKIYKQYEPVIEQLGFIDIHIVDLKGNIIYAKKHALELTNNVFSPESKRLNLDKLFLKGLKEPDIINFQRSRFSKQPVAFVAQPIINDQDPKHGTKGVLILEMPNTILEEISKKYIGDSKTRESYIVQSDYRLLTDLKFSKTRSVYNSFNNNLLIKTVGVKKALSGKTNVEIVNDYRGVPSLYAYTKIKCKHLVMGLIVKEATTEVFEEANNFNRLMMIFAFFLLMTILFTSIYMFKTEKKLIEQNLALENASQHKNKFLSHLSHELRTPLTCIVGFSNLLKDGLVGNLNDEQKDYIHRIYNNSKHLLALINDLLDIAKIDSGKMELVKEDVNPQEIIQEALTSLEPMFQTKTLNIKTSFDDSVNTAYLDKKRFYEVMYNLLSNSFKYTPENGSIEVILTRQDEYNFKVLITDTGIGIDPDEFKMIFEDFYQIEKNKDFIQGLGIGLYLCKKIINLHGGEIFVESEPGKGSKFFFILPINRVSNPDKKPEATHV